MSNQNPVATKYGMGLKTLKSYIIGLGLSLIFTIASFSLVAVHALSNTAILLSITALALAQLIAQVVFFLRMNKTAEGRWNLMPFLFTLLIVLVLVFGSLWIMYNLNYNMTH